MTMQRKHYHRSLKSRLTGSTFLDEKHTEYDPDARRRSERLAAPTDSPLARTIHASLRECADAQSGFHLLPRGVPAYEARIALIEAATVSLDLQYYILTGDTAGRLLALKLLQAADRGVRVRLLVDDLATHEDDLLAALDCHECIEVRIFNPVASRGGLPGVLERAWDIGRMNHRMHNKLLVSDGLILLTGGRNVADRCYAASGIEVLDIDVLAIGAVVGDAARTFDRYWNHRVSVPIEVLMEDRVETALDKLREQLQQPTDKRSDSCLVEALRESNLQRDLLSGELVFCRGRATLIADSPDKTLEPNKLSERDYPAYHLKRAALAAEQEILVSTAYFAPGERGLKLLQQIRRPGVKVSILTNSLSTNDVAVVHSGYCRFRSELLQSGIRLFELRATAKRGHRLRWFEGESQSQLHAKALTIDSNVCFIGSLNLDSRSILQNTEIGLLIECHELNRQLQQVLRSWLEPDVAWKLTLNGDGGIRWEARDDGKHISLERDPDTSRAQRLLIWLLSWLPIKTQI